MKRNTVDIFLVAAIIVLCFIVCQQHSARETAAMEQQTTTELPATSDQTETSEQVVLGGSATVLSRQGYTTGYSAEWRCPQWVAWTLTSDHTTGPYKRKGVSYREDTDVPSPRATNSDYMRSGYDRGHMCPSGDNKWSQQAQEDCFLFTNMCPQSHNLNGGDWNELEMKCRTWAKRYGEVQIVCGPWFRQGAKPKTIGRNRVAVPDGFWKVVLRTGNRPAAIGFYYANDDGHAAMSTYVRTVDEIEAMTGLDFFSALDDKTERRIEATANLSDW